MPAYTEKYGPRLREALFRMALDEGRGTAATFRALKAGPVHGLSDTERLDLAKMDYSYACDLVRDERQTRKRVAAAREGLVDNALLQAARLQELADRMIRQLEVKQPKAPVDADSAIRAAKLSREALALARAANDGVKAEPKPSASAEQKTTSKPRGLAAQIAARGDTEPDDNHTQTTQSEAHAVRDNARDDAMDETNDGPARASDASPAAPALAA